MRIGVIDADTMVWVASYLARERDPANDEDVKIVLNELDNFISKVLTDIKAEKYCGFLQGPGKTFRRRAFRDYKANRPEPPTWLKAWKATIVDHLTTKWQFELVKEIEVDDAVASVVAIIEDMDEHAECKTTCHTTIVCSPDKDLKQIPGWNYNTKTGELKLVTEGEAWKHMCMQLLHGDTTDNIPNVRKGVGPKRAEAILDEDPGKLAYHLTALKEFALSGNYEGLSRFAENVLKVVLRRDMDFKFTIHEVPEHIKNPLGSLV